MGRGGFRGLEFRVEGFRVQSFGVWSLSEGCHVCLHTLLFRIATFRAWVDEAPGSPGGGGGNLGLSED